LSNKQLPITYEYLLKKRFAMIDSILFWNQVALDAAKTDFSFPDIPNLPDDQKPQQNGPTYLARALAIVHLAMHDAYMGIKGTGSPKTYLTYTSSPGTTDLQAAQAAVAAAACVTLIAMFSRQKDIFLKKHSEFMVMIPDNDPKISKGLAWGHLVAAKILEDRKNDGSDNPKDLYASNDLYAPSAEPYRHRPDPLNPKQGFLGPLWGNVKPFGFNDLKSSITQLPDPVSLPAYTADFNQVKDKGVNQGGTRTLDETRIGLFWAYDGARNIGVPPRLYNQVVRAIVAKKGGVSEKDNAKLFAMVNVAMADAGIQAWHEKYKHNLWRPVVGIREADAGWGPTGKGDSQAGTHGDPFWQPLGAPRTNSSGAPSFTPPFPAYPSGHATFGTAALRIAQAVLGLLGNFAFEFVSDELNGENIGATGVRPRYKSNLTIDSAVEENILSRVYLGVHWKFDGLKGEDIGKEIANGIFANFPAKA
jgi:Vanadium chloroperoxidase N-terminal domain/PAP2 superfamily